VVEASPTISIVTPVLNRRNLIETSLSSVREQGGNAYEHLVVDGGSTDGTRDVISSDATARLIDAPGSSLYEAINIGIRQASGRIICLLNSDDTLAPGALQAVTTASASNPTADIIRGCAFVTNADATDIPQPVAPASFDLTGILFGAANINACFMARDLFERIGLFDTSLRISADREWLLRAHLTDPEVVCIDKVLYIYMAHAESLTIGGGKAAELEWVGEHLTFARRYLSNDVISPLARKHLERFHGKEVLHAAMLSAQAGDVRACLSALTRGFGTRPAWPLDCIVPLYHILEKYVAAGSRSC